MLLKIGVYLQSNIFNEQTVDGLVDSESDPRAAEKKNSRQIWAMVKDI